MANDKALSISEFLARFLRAPFGRAGLFLLAALHCAPLHGELPCKGEVVLSDRAGGQSPLPVEIAARPQELSQGLMFREGLGARRGMLFIYREPIHARFWMKNTLIPLDMLFYDEKGIPIFLEENATPGSLEIIDGGMAIAVLEVEAGQAEALGLRDRKITFLMSTPSACPTHLLEHPLNLTNHQPQD